MKKVSSQILMLFIGLTSANYAIEGDVRLNGTNDDRARIIKEVLPQQPQHGLKPVESLTIKGIVWNYSYKNDTHIFNFTADGSFSKKSYINSGSIEFGGNGAFKSQREFDQSGYTHTYFGFFNF